MSHMDKYNNIKSQNVYNLIKVIIFFFIIYTKKKNHNNNEYVLVFINKIRATS